MKNKTHITVIVIIATLTTAAWAADQSVIEDIAEQTEAGKTAPVEVPQEPQHLASKPDTVTMTDAELKTYENNILDRAEKFYTVGLTFILFFLTILATALFWTLEIYRKRRFEKITTDQLAAQRKTYEKTVQKAHDAIKEQGKEMQQQFGNMRNDMNSHVDGLSKRITKEEASRQLDSGNVATMENRPYMALAYYLFAIGNFLTATEFDLAIAWIDRVIDTVKALVSNKTLCKFFMYEAIKGRCSAINTYICEPDQSVRFVPRLSELTVLIDELEKQVVPDDYIPPQPTDPITPPESDPDA